MEISVEKKKKLTGFVSGKMQGYANQPKALCIKLLNKMFKLNVNNMKQSILGTNTDCGD